MAPGPSCDVTAGIPGGVGLALAEARRRTYRGFRRRGELSTEAFGFVIWGAKRRWTSWPRARSDGDYTPMQNPACGSLRREPETPAPRAEERWRKFKARLL